MTGVGLVNLSDQELILLVLAGDNYAYDELVIRYEKQIYTFICKMGCNPEDAKGVTQGVFFKAYNALPNFKNQCKFSTWLYTIASNRCKNWLRKSKKTVLLYETNIRDGKSNTPEEMYLKKENLAAVKKAFNMLPEKYRDVLQLYYHNNMSYVEIAQTLGLRARTVETRLYRGRQMVKSYLMQNDNEVLF